VLLLVTVWCCRVPGMGGSGSWRGRGPACVKQKKKHPSPQNFECCVPADGCRVPSLWLVLKPPSLKAAAGCWSLVGCRSPPEPAAVFPLPAQLVGDEVLALRTAFVAKHRDVAHQERLLMRTCRTKVLLAAHVRAFIFIFQVLTSVLAAIPWSVCPSVPERSVTKGSWSLPAVLEVTPRTWAASKSLHYVCWKKVQTF